MANTVTLKVFNQAGEEVSTVSLKKDVFGCEINEAVMFDAIQVYTANKRQATAKTKTTHETHGSTKKPFRQKGTGRARQGSNHSSIMVGGGTAFGPTGTQNYKIKQNKKEHNLAVRSAWTSLVKNIVVLDKLSVEGKTKEIANVLKAFKLNEKKVVLVSEDDKVLQASANICGLLTRASDNVSVYDLLNTEKVIVTVEDIKKIEEALA